MPKVKKAKIALNIDMDEIKKVPVSSNDVLIDVCDQIQEGLYLGDFCASRDYDKMKLFDVIINITPHKSEEYEGKLHIQIPIDDISSTNIRPVFDWCVPKILHFLSEGKKVFVHCHAGISRSVSVVIATLMKKNGWSYDDTLHYVASKRLQMTCPNFGFMYALKEFEGV
jgi:hypothetical protein